MRTAEAFAVGETRREASAPGTRGVGRARTTRLASVAIVTARVPQEKTTQPSDKLFASLNGVTDERAPWRSRPSRLGRSRAARGGEMPRAVYALGDASVRRAEPRSREDAYRLALQTDTVDYYTPSRNERMLRSGSAPGETSGGAPRQRESRVEAGRAATPYPDHGVAEIARSCLSAARARPARLKPETRRTRGFFNRLRRRRERAVLVGLARFSRQIRPTAAVPEKIRSPRQQ
jgi:hypothetical protein